MCNERKIALRATAAMFSLSGLWVLGSDLLVGLTVPPPYQGTAQHVKGLAYVAIAALFVYCLIYKRATQAAVIKAQRAELVEAQQLKTSALVTFGAWHDVRNLATAFSINAQCLSSTTPTSAEWREIAGEFDQLSRRLVSLTDSVHIQGWARSCQLFSPEAVMHEYLQVLNRSKLLKASARVQVTGEIPQLYGSVSRFEQMIANLVLNGDQATKGAQPVHINLGAANGAVTIDVVDHGEGISPEVLRHIWEPMFTTKASGSGLGLLIVNEAVADFGGAISVASTPGQGTCFSIRLPVPAKKSL